MQARLPTREDNPPTHWVNFTLDEKNFTPVGVNFTLDEKNFTPVGVTFTPDGGEPPLAFYSLFSDEAINKMVQACLPSLGEEPPLAFFSFLYMKITLLHIG